MTRILAAVLVFATSAVPVLAQDGADMAAEREGVVVAAKVTSSMYIDHLQMGKVNGAWKIINVLWVPNRDRDRRRFRGVSEHADYGLNYLHTNRATRTSNDSPEVSLASQAKRSRRGILQAAGV